MQRKPIYIIIKLKDKLFGHWIEIQIDQDNSSTVWMDGNQMKTETVITSISKTTHNQPEMAGIPG